MTKSKIKEITALAVVLFAVFSMYIMTMHPVFKNNDSPETTAASVTLGIGHPPGYPLYTIAGKAATMIPAGNYAFRMNVFSSVLGIAVLFITYFLLKFLVRKVSGLKGRRLCFIALAGVLILGFSYIFWNQAIEAKGGIYILNLLFLALLILLSLKLFERFRPGYLYLAAFIFGLSLANHWPSMLILAPVFCYLFFLYRKESGLKRTAVSALFFLAGLTPYLYLLIRAPANPSLNWGDPSTLEGFLWVVLRKGYIYPVEASFEVYKYQFYEAIKLFVSNYSFLWAAAVAGGYYIYRNSKRIFYFIASIFIVVFFMVVLYNRTEKDVIWLMRIFLMPACYIILIFMAAGAAWLIRKIRDRRVMAAAGALASVFFIHMFVRGFAGNNHTQDFLSYDYGYNILMTMEKGAMYHGDGDYNLMPVYYIQEIQKRRRDIKFVTASFMIFDWGIRDFIEKYGYVEMSPHETAKNISKIIKKFAPDVPVYRSIFYTRADRLEVPFYENQKGILIRYADKRKAYGPEIFDLYFYRGVFEKFTSYHRANRDLIGWYPVSMVNQANALMSAGRYREAAALGKRALLFPNEKPEGNILYNIALAYEGSGKKLKELEYLEKAIDKGTTIRRAYEKAGYYFYNMGLVQKAENVFQKAYNMGNTSENITKILNVIKNLNQKERLEIALIKANKYVAEKNIKYADKIYDFLLEKNYKKNIIYRNKGVYYFETKNYPKAIECFSKSRNETETAEIYVYIVIAQIKMKRFEQAEETLNKGLLKFSENERLLGLKEQLKRAAKQNGKNFNSNNRQRQSNRNE